jgi:allophanate hydrolase
MFGITVHEIVAAHRKGTVTPTQTIRRCYERIRAIADPGIFITLREEREAVSEAERLSDGGALYGVPVAVKDNIDVATIPTTAACPAFAYLPETDAEAVARLKRAGAIVIGKTNLDQFATGLVGLRTPFPVPRNALRTDLIPGGSSSGSAVAVAAGIVPIALGTDTAGSGRVPAMLNNIVGLKPSLGLVSMRGVVPACRTIDCVSVFALSVDDAWTALGAIAGYDADDPYSRKRPLGPLDALPSDLSLGVPRPAQRLFFGDARAAADYEAVLARLSKFGLALVEVDMEPLYETARLLYEGPWVAERYLAARNVFDENPLALHPVTREIIAAGAKPKATDAFAAFYRLEQLRRAASEMFEQIDALALPTAPTVYTCAQVLTDPIKLNSRLGTYTNFVNLLDLCGLALPAAIRGDDIPFGITLLAPAGNDALLASIGRAFHADTGLKMGARGLTQPPLAPLRASAGEDLAIAVVGAHLSGMALNSELKALGGRLVEAAITAPDYQLYALATAPPKPGMLRVEPGKGAAIELEVWALSATAFGQFVAAIPPPLSIGTIKLSDGRGVKGFLVEAAGVDGARDISAFGGWRAYVKEMQRAAE